MVQIIKSSKGFLQYFFIAIVALIVVTLLVGPLNLLSIVNFDGILDDYLVHDDFEKGYFDETLWDFQLESSYGSSSDYPEKPYVDDGILYFSQANMGSGFLGINSGKVSPRMNFAEKHFKTKIILQYVYDRYKGKGQSKANIILNGITLASLAPETNHRKPTTFIVEGQPSFSDPSKYIVTINGEVADVIDISNSDKDNKLEIEFKNAAPSYMTVRGGIEYFKYKHNANCEVNDDEIKVSDTFYPGTTFTIKNLAYDPVKFCPDDPVKARSFTDNGIRTDEYSEILLRLTRGEEITVPEEEVFEVSYITKYQAGMKERCSLGESYRTETNSCESTQDQFMVGCNTDSDCLVPQGCSGVKATCQNNKCQFSGACISKPEAKSLSLWDKIMNLALIQWITGIFT